MAVVTQIKLGTSGTTYDINDKRITTSAVSTATHFLTTDSSVSSIAPITAANAASVLGGVQQIMGQGMDANDITATGAYKCDNNMSNMPVVASTYTKGAWGTLFHIENYYRIQIYCGGDNSQWGYWIRFRTGSAWHPWAKITTT